MDDDQIRKILAAEIAAAGKLRNTVQNCLMFPGLIGGLILWGWFYGIATDWWDWGGIFAGIAGFVVGLVVLICVSAFDDWIGGRILKRHADAIRGAFAADEADFARAMQFLAVAKTEWKVEKELQKVLQAESGVTFGTSGGGGAISTSTVSQSINDLITKTKPKTGGGSVLLGDLDDGSTPPAPASPSPAPRVPGDDVLPLDPYRGGDSDDPPRNS